MLSGDEGGLFVGKRKGAQVGRKNKMLSGEEGYLLAEKKKTRCQREQGVVRDGRRLLLRDKKPPRWLTRKKKTFLLDKGGYN